MYRSAVPASSSTRWSRIYAPENRRLGLEMKRVMRLLRESKQPLTPEQISEHVVDVECDKAFFKTLAKCPNVNFDGHRFSHKSTLHLLDPPRLTHAFAEADLIDATVAEEEMVDDDLCSIENNKDKSNKLVPVSNKQKMKKISRRRPMRDPALLYDFLSQRGLEADK